MNLELPINSAGIHRRILIPSFRGTMVPNIFPFQKVIPEKESRLPTTIFSVAFAVEDHVWDKKREKDT